MSVSKVCKKLETVSKYLFIMPCDHNEEVIPVPIPNTEVKLSRANDTADQVGK